MNENKMQPARFNQFELALRDLCAMQCDSFKNELNFYLETYRDSASFDGLTYAERVRYACGDMIEAYKRTKQDRDATRSEVSRAQWAARHAQEVIDWMKDEEAKIEARFALDNDTQEEPEFIAAIIAAHGFVVEGGSRDTLRAILFENGRDYILNDDGTVREDARQYAWAFETYWDEIDDTPFGSYVEDAIEQLQARALEILRDEWGIEEDDLVDASFFEKNEGEDDVAATSSSALPFTHDMIFENDELEVCYLTADGIPEWIETAIVPVSADVYEMRIEKFIGIAADAGSRVTLAFFIARSDGGTSEVRFTINYATEDDLVAVRAIADRFARQIAMKVTALGVLATVYEIDRDLLAGADRVAVDHGDYIAYNTNEKHVREEARGMSDSELAERVASLDKALEALRQTFATTIVDKHNAHALNTICVMRDVAARELYLRIVSLNYEIQDAVREHMLAPQWESTVIRVKQYARRALFGGDAFVALASLEAMRTRRAALRKHIEIVTAGD